MSGREAGESEGVGRVARQLSPSPFHRHHGVREVGDQRGGERQQADVARDRINAGGRPSLAVGVNGVQDNEPGTPPAILATRGNRGPC